MPGIHVTRGSSMNKAYLEEGPCNAAKIEKSGEGRVMK